MRIISTRVHGTIDYMMGLLLIASPWIFNFYHGGAETWVPIVLGLGAIVYSMFTNYEAGIFRKIPMTTHLTIDLVSGVLLAASPWIFGFNELVYLPHLILGLAEIGASLMTQTQSTTSRVMDTDNVGGTHYSGGRGDAPQTHPTKS